MITRACIFTLISLTLLASCKDDEERAVIEHRTTPNGFEYAYLPVEDATGWKITMRTTSTWPRLGSVEHNQTALFLVSDMLNLSGFDDLAAIDKQAAFEDLKSNAGVSVNDDSIYADIYVEKSELDTVMPLLVGSFNRPNFEDEWLQRLKAPLMTNLSNFLGTPNGVAFQMPTFRLGQLNELVTLSHETVATMNDLTVDDLYAWLAHMEDNGLAIGVAGTAELEMLDVYLDELLAKFDPQAPIKPLPDIVTDKPISIALVDPNAENAVVQIIYYETKNDHECTECLGWDLLTRDALTVGGVASRLNNAIRSKDNSSYGFGAETFGSGGYNYSGIAISGQVNPSDLSSALSSIYAEIDDLQANGVTAEETTAMNEAFIGFHSQIFDDENLAAKIMSDLRFHEQYVGEIVDLYAPIDALTSQTQDTITQEIKDGLPASHAFSTYVITPELGDLEVDCVIEAISEIARCYQ